MSAVVMAGTARRFRGAFAGLLVAGGVGCGGDSGTDLVPGGDLSQAEAAQLLVALMSVYAPSPAVPAARSTAAGRPLMGPESAESARLVPITSLIADTIRTTLSCPAGGSLVVVNRDSIQFVSDVRLNPSPDTSVSTVATYSGRVDIETEYLGCGAAAGSGGVWTFDASPGLLLGFTLEGESRTWRLTNGASASSSNAASDGLWAGTLSWRNGGRSGQCPFSLTITARTSLAPDGQVTASFAQSGQICGLAVSTSGSV